MEGETSQSDKPIKFERAKIGSRSKDAKGTVYVKIILQIPNGQAGFPMPGNRKEEIEIHNSSVGEVYKAINNSLFGGQE